MRTFNIHHAKTHLSRLVDEAVQGNSFIIAKAGKPKVQVIRLGSPTISPQRRLGFLKGQIKVPDDFDTMMADEIEKMFSGEE
ncbi:MAG: type II toxin-antitoxin system prevent-host-death family antitoxin [Terracidiphilus sp.]|jgi:antitoxin (DNA-binding transcriptional repressor) of toxin-antitoxin stability system